MDTAVEINMMKAQSDDESVSSFSFLSLFLIFHRAILNLLQQTLLVLHKQSMFVVFTGLFRFQLISGFYGNQTESH